jgi:hypothetical protein
MKTRQMALTQIFFLTILQGGTTYQAGVIFPTSGNCWLAFHLGGDIIAKFQLNVEPAQ